jgi:phospholipase D1/2
MTRMNANWRSFLSHLVVVLLICGLGFVIWNWIPRAAVSPQEFAAWLAPHRRAWYAPPMVILTFIALGLAMVPVLLLIAATGIAFGPVLGPVYAMAGCLASASTGFALGRWMGLKRVKQLGGDWITRITRALKRNGIFAVYLIRKIPAPFTLVNMVIGASTVRFRDFIIGTLLGMGVFVIALAGFGYQLAKTLRHPSAGTILIAALFIAVPLTIAWLINRALRQAEPA